MTAKIRRSLVASVAALSMTLTACSSAEESTSGSSDTSAASSSETTEITLEDNFGEKKIAAPVSAPAVTDNRAFEILADWDVKIAAAPLKLVPSTVRDVYNKDTVAADLGSHREPDLESLVAAEPDVVWNGQRFEQHQEDIEKLVEDVPVLDFEPRDDKDFFEELKRHTEALGQTFGHEEDAAKLIEDFDAAAKRAKEAYDPSKKVMAVNTSGGEIGYIAPKIGRTYGPVFDLIGMTPALEVPEGTDDHEGDDISVEAIAESNPDWILVMDRDAAVSKEGEEHVPGDKLVNENAALKNVTAVKEGNVYVAPADTYVNESIITYTEILNALADAFEKRS
ncbi:TPA: ABC transporter substrate-binding protein [Corynebacterium striatum]|uniref:Periplasmic binding family protein n=1 Tax=Corynebacterium simulans TaxID=146827 RepID=A0ABR5V5Q3_9CORY|nr:MULTISPECIES: ABC transporter substrate-binding protein [Corynebacterium]KXU16836.1 periplasmic binding family protein [Corynebacterium simulans]OFR36613.1 iron ABC transporter substrate-binding protein [Corynebacterium sp. HMSC077D03]HBC8576527.1 ABC transporter substrate-binding protein [Corynebacterium striatum]